MKFCCLIPAIVMVLIGQQGIAQKKDTLQLYNGQILIGDIKGAREGVLTIDDRDLKLQNIKLYKIRSLSAVHSIFKVETTQKEEYYTTLGKSELEGNTRINKDGKPTNVMMIDISTIIPLKQGFLKNLDGNFGLGFSFSKSSGIGQLSMNSTVYYAEKKTQYRLTASSISSIDSSKLSRDNESAQLFGSYNLGLVWQIAAQLTYQRNLELGLNRRFQEMLGAGNKLLVSKNWRIYALSGASVGQEHSTTGVNTFTVELPLIFNLNYFYYQKLNVHLVATQSVFFSITEMGRFRYDGTISYSQDIITNFSVSLNFYTYFDSRPLEKTSSKLDYGTSLNINYRF